MSKTVIGGVRKHFLAFIITILLSLMLIGCSGLDASTSATTTSDRTSANSLVASSTVNSSNTSTVAAIVPSTTAVPAKTAALDTNTNLQPSIKDVVKTVSPGVVLVSVLSQTQDNFGRVQQGQGIGTGSIITPDGYIITNNHVIENGTNIRVALNDGRKFDARLIGHDPANDIAVIKIEGQNLPTVKMGDSTKLEVGDWVVAIGNALGLKGGSSVTAGIVSALGRSIDEENGVSLTDLIQTDAAINPGNSGGPLVNLNGEIVGINTAVASSPLDGGAAQSIGFAISINQVKPLIESFIQGKPIVRPYMGINLTNVNSAVALRYNLPVDKGVLITSVVANSPASRAKWQAGDVIIKMDNTAIEDSADISKFLLTRKPGDTISVTLTNRSKNERNTQLVLGEKPPSP